MRITEDILRSKAEHNEGKLTDLEEIALHQLDIEKIEIFDKLCRHIKILLLQNNQIQKIENIKRLKELEYLNLALNNIELIENLENNESLNKLDLTCNFIELKNYEESLLNLKKCPSIKELYLMGNPCTDWNNYKNLAIAICNNLVSLDGKDILPSERILAQQNINNYLEELDHEIIKVEKSYNELSEKEKKKKYSKNQRIEMYKELSEQKEKDDKEKNPEKYKEKKISSQYNNKGEFRQCNEGKYKFNLNEWDDPEFSFFTLKIPKYMDNEYIKSDLFPNFISIRIKNKLTQIKLFEEIIINESKIQRSRVTGELYIKMKKMRYDKNIKRQSEIKKKDETKEKLIEKNNNYDLSDLPELI